ncbi:MAG: hypothetical protein GOV01_03410 [Candidatus Altiarchaeota archaeon]|nr:hypothetical protein [Candidatus Altiarchaeota archaeon]
MSAPHVTGAAALLLEAASGLNLEELFTAILEGAHSLGLSLQDSGRGLLDVNASYYFLPRISPVSRVLNMTSPTYGEKIIETLVNQGKGGGKLPARLYYFSNSSNTGFNLTNKSFEVALEENISFEIAENITERTWINVSYRSPNTVHEFTNFSFLIEKPQDLNITSLNCTYGCGNISMGDTVNITFDLLGNYESAVLTHTNSTNSTNSTYFASGYFEVNPFEGNNTIDAVVFGGSGSTNKTLFKFTTGVSEDMTPPPAPVVSTQTTTNTLTVSWQDPADPTWNGTVVRVYGFTKSEIDAPSLSKVISGLSPSTSYVVGVQFIDHAGNIGDETNKTVNTASPPSSTPSSSSGPRIITSGFRSPIQPTITPQPKPNDTIQIGENVTLRVYEAKTIEAWNFTAHLGVDGQLNVTKANLSVPGYVVLEAFNISLENVTLERFGVFKFDGTVKPVAFINESGQYFIGMRIIPPPRYRPLENTTGVQDTPEPATNEPVQLQVDLIGFVKEVFAVLFSIFQRFF